MPDDLLPNDPATPPPAPAVVPPSTRKITCEFCKCQLAPNGDYLALSDEAKSYRALSEKLEALKATITELQTTITTITGERDQARATIERHSPDQIRW